MLIETLKALCLLPGVSSGEDEVRRFLLERAKPHASRVRVDALGNLIVEKKGEKTTGSKLMLCAHMDEVGLIVKRITDEGYLKFGCVGGIDRRVLIGKRVLVGPAKVPGVIGLKAVHLTTAEERSKIPKLEEFYLDIGAGDREEAERLVSLGDPCVFDDTVVEFGEGYLKAKAIDDRLGCAVMLKLIESELPCDCTFVFTVQEEVGTRGAKTAAFTVQPDVCLVLEGTTAADIPGSTEANEVCRLDGGVVMPFMDRGTLYDPALYRALTAIADENGIRWQTKRMIAGGTDASAIQRANGGVKTIGLACGIRNLHSPACVANTADFEPMLALAGKFIQAFSEGRI